MLRRASWRGFDRAPLAFPRVDVTGDVTIRDELASEPEGEEDYR
jgi:hypothetical protein